jgi:hypothetical protein
MAAGAGNSRVGNNRAGKDVNVNDGMAHFSDGANSSTGPRRAGTLRFDAPPGDASLRLTSIVCSPSL